jgi:hypothetical protein
MPSPDSKARYKSFTRDQIREKINSAKCLNRIEKCVSILERDYLKLGPEEVSAVGLIINTQFRLLAKVLPDLKAVEHSGNLQVDTAIKITVSG